MLKDSLAAVAASIGLEVKGDTVCGTYKGFGLTVKAAEEQSCCVITFFARKGALTDKTADKFLEEYKTQNAFIKAIKNDGFVLGAVYSCSDGEDICVPRTLTVIEDTVTFLMMNYYSNVCAKCGSAIGLCFVGDKQLCKSCADAELKAAAEAPAPVQSAEYAAPTQPTVNPAPAQPMMNTAPIQPMINPNPAQPQFTDNGGYGAGAAMMATGAAMGAFAAPGGSYAPNATAYNEVYNSNPANAAANLSVTPTPSDQQAPELMTAPDYMGTVGLDTMPESTGYATKESLAAIPMPARNVGDPMAMITGDYSMQQQMNGAAPQNPIADAFSQQTAPGFAPSTGDFRADDSYYNAPPIYGNVYNTPLEPESSNVPLGILGAFIFSLIGCAAWIIVGKLGYVSMWCGLLLSFLCTFGYKKLGKKFDIFGFIVCAILIILEVLVCNILIETWSICENEYSLLVANLLGFDGFGDIFFGWFDFMSRFDSFGFTDDFGKELSVTTEFLMDLGLSYLFSLVVYIFYGISMYKNDKT